MKLPLNTLANSVNIADELDDEELDKISAAVRKGYDIDVDSCQEWREITEKALDAAKQVMQTKNHPFPGASNVKYPLITKAAIDFAARTYPEIVQNNRVVRATVHGSDLDGAKQARAERVEEFMSYQLLEKNTEWEDGTDSLLHMLPVLGTIFRKTYYDVILKRPVSVVCESYDLVVNRNIKSLETARRITHVINLYKNEIVERIRAGIFSDVDLDKLTPDVEDDMIDEQDEDAPLSLLEQHCYLDLDGDGYQEPYIVTVHEDSGTVLRIKPRYTIFNIEHNDAQEVVYIQPQHFFTDYHFIKNPDGGFYSLGLGALLLPINESINTLLNQLIDSGTLNNLQGGFIGRGLRLKGGEFRVKMGEWKILDAAGGSNIRENVVPLPTKEPSSTLFSLLGLLIDVGKDLSSANDALQGKQAATNVPATTMLALIEQGLKVFNAVQKRIYRSFKREYQKVFQLNAVYLRDDEYQTVLDQMVTVAEDFSTEDLDIAPLADPSMSSDAQRLTRAQALLALPGVDEKQKVLHYLRALQFSEAEIQQLVQAESQPDPAQQQMQIAAQEAAMKAQNEMKRLQILVEQLKVQSEDVETRRMEAEARVRKMEHDAQVNLAKIHIATAKASHQADLSVAELDQKELKEELRTVTKIAEIDQRDRHDEREEDN